MQLVLIQNATFKNICFLLKLSQYCIIKANKIKSDSLFFMVDKICFTTMEPLFKRRKSCSFKSQWTQWLSMQEEADLSQRQLK